MPHKGIRMQKEIAMGSDRYQKGGEVKKPSTPTKPPPEMLGTGLAAQAGKALKSRKQRLEEEERKATGYAGGGAVPQHKQIAMGKNSQGYCAGGDDRYSKGSKR